MNSYLTIAKKELNYYKQLGDKTFVQVPEQFLFMGHNESNSIAVIVKHLRGNMLSRWTDFLTSDGEKPWRNRDSEFVNDWTKKQEVLDNWEEGWQCVFNALEALTEANLNETIYIRNSSYTVLEVIARQQSHYAYHVGQIVFLGKYFLGKNWKSLSIPKGQSEAYSQE